MRRQAAGIPRRVTSVSSKQRERRVRHGATLRVEVTASLGSKTVAMWTPPHRDRAPQEVSYFFAFAFFAGFFAGFFATFAVAFLAGFAAFFAGFLAAFFGAAFFASLALAGAAFAFGAG